MFTTLLQVRSLFTQRDRHAIPALLAQHEFTCREETCFFENIKQVDHKFAIEVEVRGCTLTPCTNLRRAPDRFERSNEDCNIVASMRLLPGREVCRKEVPMLDPSVLKPEDTGFWDGGGEREEDWRVIRGGFGRDVKDELGNTAAMAVFIRTQSK